MKSARSRKRAHDARTARILALRHFDRAIARAIARVFDQFAEAIRRSIAAGAAFAERMRMPMLQSLGGKVEPCPHGGAPQDAC